MNRPQGMLGMRHVALNVHNLSVCEQFYVDVLGLQVEWRPDPDNVYLAWGGDSLALHRADPQAPRDATAQRLDHIGFLVTSAAAVDSWYSFLQEQGVRMRSEPRTHRDGARSFYCFDPEGTVVQIIHHLPVIAWEAAQQESRD